MDKDWGLSAVLNGLTTELVQCVPLVETAM